jgi:RNA polymerase sigma factor (sigma-70 family)
VAAVPSIGRADRAAGAVAPEATLTQALYERHATQIFRYCLHQLGSREEAEDAVQSTFLNAFRGIKRGVVPANESAWLFKIAGNVCLSRRRSTWRRGRVESPTDFDVVEELTPAPSRVADELLGLQDVLEQMPESQRRAILLREWQGLSYREIAEELQLSQTAVETLIFRARRSLAKGLERPPEPAQKRRMVRGADLGNLLTGLKSLLLGGSAAAAKAAAVVAVVGAGTVAASSPAPHRARTHVPAAPARAAPVAPAAPARAAPVAPAVSVPVVDLHRPVPVRHAPHAAAPVEAPAPADVPAAAPSADQPALPADVSSTPAPVVSAPPAQAPPTSSTPPAPTDAPVTDEPGTQSGSGQGQGRGGGRGQGQGNGNGNGSGNGKDSTPGASPDQGTGSPPPPEASSSGNGGNGNGNGSGGQGEGHGSGGGHGH